MSNSNTVLNPKAVRKNNYRAVVRTFNKDDILSITEITERISMSKTTAAKIVDALVRIGMVLPRGKGTSTDSGGKRPELYAINPNYKYFGLVLFEKYRLYIEVRNFSGNLVGNFTEAYDATVNYKSRIKEGASYFNELLTENGLNKESLAGVVLTMGNLNYVRKDTFNAGYLSEDELKRNLASLFADAFVFNNPVYIMDSRYLRGSYELYADTALQGQKFVTVTVHKRGVSGCYLQRGNILQGATGALGEFSHIATEFDSPITCECGQKGCFCTVCRGEIVLDGIETELEENCDSILSHTGEEKLTMQKVFEACDKDDQLAKKHINKVIDNFVRFIGVLQVTLDPERIVIQGTYSNPGEYFRKVLREKIDNNGLFSSINLQITYSQVSELEAITLGAFEVCRNNYLEHSDCFD